jgi:hypothetical protein
MNFKEMLYEYVDYIQFAHGMSQWPVSLITVLALRIA